MKYNIDDYCAELKRVLDVCLVAMLFSDEEFASMLKSDILATSNITSNKIAYFIE